MKVKITRLSKKDAHYCDRKELIGLTGEINPNHVNPMGKWNKMRIDYKGFAFVPDEGTNPFGFSPIHFAFALFEEVKQQ